MSKNNVTRTLCPPLPPPETNGRGIDFCSVGTSSPHPLQIKKRDDNLVENHVEFILCPPLPPPEANGRRIDFCSVGTLSPHSLQIKKRDENLLEKHRLFALCPLSLQKITQEFVLLRNHDQLIGFLSVVRSEKNKNVPECCSYNSSSNFEEVA